MATYPFGYTDRSTEGIGNATSLQGSAIQSAGKTNDDLLQYNGGNNTWEYKSVGEVLGIVGGSDNQIIRYDADTGFLQNSSFFLSDDGILAVPSGGSIYGTDLTITGGTDLITQGTITAKFTTQDIDINGVNTGTTELSSGDHTVSGNNTGNVTIKSGNAIVGTTGNINIETGNTDGAGTAGDINVNAGNAGDGGVAGNIFINSGTAGIGGTSSGITMNSGGVNQVAIGKDSTTFEKIPQCNVVPINNDDLCNKLYVDNSGIQGVSPTIINRIALWNDATASSLKNSNIRVINDLISATNIDLEGAFSATLRSNDALVGGDSGDLSVRTGNIDGVAVGTNDTGNMVIKTGDANFNANNTGNSGDLTVLTGNSQTLTGDILMSTGASTTTNSGSFTLNTGTASSGNSGNLSFTTGIAGVTAGNIAMSVGNNQKLLITPTLSTFSDQVAITDATISTTPATGALVVTGGVGIGDDLYVADSIHCSSINVDGNKLYMDSVGAETVLEAGIGNLVMNVNSGAPPKGVVLRQQTTDLLAAKNTGITCSVPVLATDINSIGTGGLFIATTEQGGASNSGNLTVRTGTTANGNSGLINIASGQPSGNGNSGDVSINSGFTSSGISGSVNVSGGNSGSTGGTVNIKGGSRYSVGNGSNCNITGGDSGSTSGLGGDVVVSGGLGQNDIGGNIEVKSGVGGGIGGSSGTVLVRTPNATGLGSAGTITIRGGDGSGAGSSNGGDIVLEAGASSGASIGRVLFGTDTTTAHLFTRGPAPTASAGTINPLSTDVAGSVSGLAAGPNSTTITFNKPYRGGAGIIVQITPTSSSVLTPLYVSASSTTSFTVQNPNTGAGVGFNYTVMACI